MDTWTLELVWHLWTLNLASSGQCGLKIQLYNIMKWLSEGTDVFKKIHILVSAYIRYNAFAFTGHVTLNSSQYGVMVFTEDQTME